jgi:alpha-L-fucosidase 2
VEMLLQSHDPDARPLDLTDAQSGRSAVLQLLPALPDAFPSGSVTGLRARGGLAVDITWKNGKLLGAVIHAHQTKPVHVRYAGKEVTVHAKAGQSYRFGAELTR